MTPATTIVKNLDTFCESNGLRITKPRQYVYEIVADAQKPIGAYDILAKLSKKLDNPKPPTAYRALEFLSEHGFIHRIESLNAYVICHSGHHHAGSQFMICDNCGRVIEAHLCHLPDDFLEQTSSENFTPKSWNIEIHGRCDQCR